MKNQYNVLDAMERSNKITPEGKCWLERALDPFHDFEVNCTGMPDSDTSKVVVQELNQTLSLAAPAGQTDGTWDVNIFTCPIASLVPSGGQIGISPGALVRGALSSGGYNGTALTADNGYVGDMFLPAAVIPYQSWNFLNACSVRTGFGTLPSSTSTGLGVSGYAGLSPPTNITGRRRLIACGFEVHNTTAPNFRQGTVTTYRIPQSSKKEYVYAPFNGSNVTSLRKIGSTPVPGLTNNPFGTPMVTEFDVYDMPPSTINEAMLYPGSRQWEAADGCYVVAAMDVKRNNLALPDLKPFAFIDGDFPTPNYNGADYPTTWPQALSNSGLFQNCLYSPVNVMSGTSGSYFHSWTAPYPTLKVPYHTAGAFFTGLSLSTTLTVTLRTTWEVSPLDGDTSSALVPLAKPSPEYDPVALELYQRVLTHMPTGVPVHMNAEGDFWDWTLKILRDVTPVFTAVLPGGAALGAAGSKLIESARQYRNRENKPDDKVFRPEAMKLPSGGTSSAQKARSNKKR